MRSMLGTHVKGFACGYLAGVRSPVGRFCPQSHRHNLQADLWPLVVLGAASTKALTRETRTWIIDSFSIEEEHPGPYPFVLGPIRVEQNYRLRFRLTGSGVDKDPVGVLSIDTETGNIIVHRKVDYELFPHLKAINASNEMVETRLGVEINILDINDNEPTFQKEVYNTTVEESRQQGQLVLIAVATDYDKKGSPNSTIDYRIVSVKPETPNVQFYIEKSGRISFKGCLDYEKAKVYTMVVEAKDRGEVQRRSSSCAVIVNVEDRNNHMPVFVGHRGPWRVKEREAGKQLLRLQVTDKDSRKTAAWRARYTLHGEDSDSFHVDTDPETNEGILSVIKPLDYEEGSWRNLSVSVENESPFFSCEVTGRPPQGLWTVTYVDSSGEAARPRMRKISIAVEDVNDPPEFLVGTKNVTVDENVESGSLLVNFTVEDEDTHFASNLVCRRGKDPAGWIDIDPRTCEIRTAKVFDRESPFVVNGTYTVTIIALDNGQPPMTGTATLNIHLRDQNDNIPQLTVTELDMCLMEGESRVSITAFDLDGYPYSGPFTFELLDNAEGHWTVQPSLGTTVSLVTKRAVHAGHHELRLKISDMQGLSSQWNVSVTVCHCSFEPNCHAPRVSSSRAGGVAVGVVLGVLLLLMGMEATWAGGAVVRNTYAALRRPYSFLSI
ncbi:hypothetical protein Z043_113321 [Scleropages formosus]|uniref:Cadherin domain-containing protein n=1 Tax=Scleropages formosus TaxID=113540 RepID=A0A0P7V186_SCLFO|nr:hypothetical protein Z043_113321 [Scleropages formosus]